jgi:hypothetical protein
MTMAKIGYDTTGRVREAAQTIQDACNKFVLKHRDTDAVIQNIWALAQVLGWNLAVNKPPPDVLDELLKRIRACAELSEDEIETFDVTNTLQ